MVGTLRFHFRGLGSVPGLEQRSFLPHSEARNFVLIFLIIYSKLLVHLHTDVSKVIYLLCCAPLPKINLY